MLSLRKQWKREKEKEQAEKRKVFFRIVTLLIINKYKV